MSDHDAVQQVITMAWITVVVGTTPEIDRQRAVNQALGERFVMVRWKRADMDAALKAITQDRDLAHSELRMAVKALLTALPNAEVDVNHQFQERIVSLAELAVRGRTHVWRDPDKKNVTEPPQPESATRLAQQLCQLAKGSARLDLRREVQESDFAVARRAGIDCISPRRWTILEQASRGEQRTDNSSTTKQDVDDLNLLDLMQGTRWLSALGGRLFDDIWPPKAVTKSPPSSDPKTPIEGSGGLFVTEPAPAAGGRS